jgi:hypothetical protein
MQYRSYPLSFISKQKAPLFLKLPPHIYSLFESEHSAKIFIGTEENARVAAFLSFEPSFSYMEVEHLAFSSTEFDEKEKDELIKQIEREAHKEKMEWIAIRLDESHEGSSFLRNALLANGYRIDKAPFLETQLFHKRTFCPNWFFQRYNLPEGHVIKLWRSLTKMQENVLRRRVEEGNIPEFISPFITENYTQLLNSVFIESPSKEVVGWMITHTFPSSLHTVDYTSFFLERNLRGSGSAQALLQRALQIQLTSTDELSLKKMRFSLNYHRSPVSWRQFVQEGLSPFAEAITYSFLAKKRLP